MKIERGEKSAFYKMQEATQLCRARCKILIFNFYFEMRFFENTFT